MTVAGTQIGRYRVDSRLGSGGMAVVYLGRDQRLGRPVAIKLLADNLAADESFRRRFLREARLAAALSHPNIVRVYDVGEDDDRRPFIVMELVDGESLAATLERERRLDPGRVTAIGLDCCAGLGYAHAAGLVHRDIKPHNLLADAGGLVKIADFGVARSLDGAAITRTGSVLGTAGYLAPEQARGERVSTAADIYALGATLHQLLTGSTPGLPGAVTAPGGPRGEVPEPLRVAVMRCLDPDPGRRPTAEALSVAMVAGDGDAATRVMDVRPDTGRTMVLGDGARPGGGLRRRQDPRRTAIAAAIVALMLAAAIVWLAIGARGGDGHAAGSGHRRTPASVAAPAVGATPAETARNLAAWIRSHSG